MRQLKISRSITVRESHSLEKYLQEIGKVKMLLAEEEEVLAKRIQQGDIAALHTLTSANLRFVVSVAKQYQNQGLSLSDLINEGNCGLLTAAKRYDETKGFKFISYAVWWIRQSILQALAEHSRIIRLPLNKVSLKNRMAREFTVLEQKYQRAPSSAEMATHLQVKQEEIEIIARTSEKHLSIDAPVVADEQVTLLDFLVNDNAINADINVQLDSLKTDVARALSVLSQRQRIIIEMYFGIDVADAYSLEDIALHFGLSRERVRQIKDKAIDSIKLHRQSDILRLYL